MGTITEKCKRVTGYAHKKGKALGTPSAIIHERCENIMRGSMRPKVHHGHHDANEAEHIDSEQRRFDLGKDRSDYSGGKD